MNSKKSSIRKRLWAMFASFLVFMGLLTGVGTTVLSNQNVYAVEGEDTTSQEVDVDSGNSTSENNKLAGDSCKNSLGALGWLVCPTTGKISEAVDWLYDKIEEFLVVSPVSADDGTPIYEIWKYCRGITNVVFIIFLLVVIYSQITGLGISNYGLKKTLPKLIVTVIMVNLSFLICQLAVDVSNILGSSLRGLFTSVEQSTLATSTAGVGPVSLSSVFSALTGGATLAIGAGAIAFDAAMIWMLIPVVLGAIVAVVTGLITIALRQAVVVLLIMVSPLAMVANMLPNTEQWFRKWKDLLTKMLIFYPMFSLLFGASSLAGFAIIMSATDGFGLMLGIAVQIFPLFFSWSLMKMSGTILGTINAKLNGLTSGAIAGARTEAAAQRALSQKKNLLRKPYTPSLRLMQFMNKQRIIRDEKMSKYDETIRNRALAKYSLSHYNKDGSISKKGEEDYELQKRNLRYQQVIATDNNNFNRGLAGWSKEYKGSIANMKRDFDRSQGAFSPQIRGVKLEDRLKNLDTATVEAADELKMELARGTKIEFDNAIGYHERIEKARQANDDLKAIARGDVLHKAHGVLSDSNNALRFESMKRIMEGNEQDTLFIGADAAHGLSSQSQIIRGKFKNLYNYTGPTQDLANSLKDLTESKNSKNYIDPIIAGLDVLANRGDTDLVEEQLTNLLKGRNIELGTYASQSLANYLMFDVGGKDPYLRRFGKYINLETAKLYNRPENEEKLAERRTRKDISFYEFVNGEYINRDEDGNVIYNDDGKPDVVKTRKPAVVLLNGTTFKQIERTAIPEMNSSISRNSVDLSIDENGNEVGEWNYEKAMKNIKGIWGSIMANIIGDQFSYLSGSEQIVALGKGLTGMDVNKHKLDFESIVGKDNVDKLTLKQKREILNMMLDRTGTFLGGQVPSQIARTKTDILLAVKNLYAYAEAANDEKTGDEFLADTSESGYKMSNKDYKDLQDKYMDKIKERFVKSYSPDALKGFVKMHHKGYQGEAKDGLIQMLDPDALYEQYFGHGKGNNNPRTERNLRDDDDDDDDGMPVTTDESEYGDVSAVYSEARNDIESIYDSYRTTKSLDVEGFWNEVKDVINKSLEISNKDYVIDDIESGMAQFTSVSDLYAHIINLLFGGFD